MTEKAWKSSWVRCSVVQMALAERGGEGDLGALGHGGRERTVCLLPPAYPPGETEPRGLSLEPVNQKTPFAAFRSVGCKALRSRVFFFQSVWKCFIWSQLSCAYCMSRESRATAARCLVSLEYKVTLREKSQHRWGLQSRKSHALGTDETDSGAEIWSSCVPPPGWLIWDAYVLFKSSFLCSDYVDNLVLAHGLSTRGSRSCETH